MNELIKKYEALRSQYPEYITKEQFYKIARISKATALYLLKSGKIPCKDSGKKTRRYKIHIDAVIKYLIDREIHPHNYRAPRANTRSIMDKYDYSYYDTLRQLTENEKINFRNYLEKKLEFCEDLLTIKDAVNLFGYCPKSFQRWCAQKKIKSFVISRKILIPKECLIDFILSPYSFNISKKSYKHAFLIRKFLDSLKENGCT